MRSKLFVPGSRPELFDKALAGDADALSFDLEDSVVEPQGRCARGVAGAAASRPAGLRQDADRARQPARLRTSRPTCEPWCARRALLVNLPKVEATVDDRRQPRRRSSGRARERRRHRAGSACCSTSRRRAALRLAVHAGRGASARGRPAARPRRPVRAAGDRPPRAGGAARGDAAAAPGRRRGRCIRLRRRVRAHSRTPTASAPRPAWRGAWATSARAASTRARSCIANEVFRPDDDEIAHARRVVAAAGEADARGVGAYIVDGRMVDAPFVRARGPCWPSRGGWG